MNRQGGALLLAGALALGGCIVSGGGEAGDGEFAEIPGIGATRVDVPRPTGPASAPCDDDPMPPSSDDSIVDRVRELRAIGLFADRSAMSDVELAADVEAAIIEVWGTIDVADASTDLAVAEQDRTRVWWRDLEADVVDGNDVYVHIIAEWGEISVGIFQPTNIAESWDGAEGPVTLQFDHEGSRHTITPAYLEDWIDPGILVGINELIADSSRRFELYKAFDQTAFVMALTDDERRTLETRGWCFE